MLCCLDGHAGSFKEIMLIDQEQAARVLQFFSKFAVPGQDLMSSYSISAVNRMDP